MLENSKACIKILWSTIKLGKKAKDQIYDLLSINPSIKRNTLCKQTQKALKIDLLLKYNRNGQDTVQYIKTYSADTISRFTNPQI